MQLPPMPQRPCDLTVEERRFHIWAARACYWHSRYLIVLSKGTSEQRHEASERNDAAFSRLNSLNATLVAREEES